MMSQQPPATPPSGRTLSNPQVLIALISGIVTVLVALLGVLPNLVNRAAPTATPTATFTLTPSEIAATATPLVATETPSVATATPITLVPSPSALPPLDATAPTVPQSGAPNARLFIDDASFTVLNLSGRTLSLLGVVFTSASGRWEARSWGPSLHDRLPDGDCLRIRDMAAGRRSPPPECGDLFGLIEVGASALFWREVESFEVQVNGAVIATCPLSAPTCDVFIPQN